MSSPNPGLRPVHSFAYLTYPLNLLYMSEAVAVCFKLVRLSIDLRTEFIVRTVIDSK